MSRFSGSRPCAHLLFGALVVVVATYGCGADFSPTAPSLPQASNGVSFGNESFAVVSGQLVPGGGLSAANSTGGFAGEATASVVGLTITVQGTTIKTTTDASGNFRLVNVPSGTIVLQITGAGTNATVTIQGVGANQHVQITVQVQSSSAQVVQTEVEELDELEGNVIAVNTSGSSFTLENGTTVFVNLQTSWDPGGDLFSLADVEAALSAGQSVEVEGRTITVDGQRVVTVVKAEADDDDNDDGTVADFSLEIKPDEWRLEWADGGTSGSGGENLRARIEDGPFSLIDPSTVTMTGPTGEISPVSTEIKGDYFQAEFSKVTAIAIVAGVPEGGTATITVAGMLLDGTTAWQLFAEIAIKEDDDDDDEEDDDDEDNFEDAIEDIDELVEDGALSDGNGNALVATLHAARDSLEKGNATPAVNQLQAFINNVEAFVKGGQLDAGDDDDENDLIEDAEEIIEDLTGD